MTGFEPFWVLIKAYEKSSLKPQFRHMSIKWNLLVKVSELIFFSFLVVYEIQALFKKKKKKKIKIDEGNDREMNSN